MFKEIPATKKSLSNRRSIFGVGINDSEYVTQPVINGKQVTCLIYRAWTHMMERCYSGKLQEKLPTYKDCSVCDEWLMFSNFRSWMNKQDWQGKHLDKDIVITGNKHYSPDTCIFVSQEINKLLTNSAGIRGKHPQGVSFRKDINKFQSRCSVGSGRNKSLGFFDTPEDASLAYRSFKAQVILDVAVKQGEPLKGYLKRIAVEYKEK